MVEVGINDVNGTVVGSMGSVEAIDGE